MITAWFSIPFHTLLIIPCFWSFLAIQAQEDSFTKGNIIELLYKVNNYQVKMSSDKVSRNWKQATYYSGVMAFYKVTLENKLLDQAISWAERNAWKTGNEMFFPANRLTCTQTYLEIFFIRKDSSMINKTKEYLDAELVRTEPAYLRGWYYVDALYVGIPPFMMMSAATGQKKYSGFGDRLFWEIADQLYDSEENLFYRDSEARYHETSKNNKKSLWSRGNGWAMASIPRILTYLDKEDITYYKYAGLMQKMAIALQSCQGDDGLWRTNLADKDEFPMPESSGTAFFTYALAWGINNGILERSVFEPVVKKAWKGLCSIVNDDGKVCWGQPEARKPGSVKKENNDEFVTGAFLLAGSEMVRLVESSIQH